MTLVRVATISEALVRPVATPTNNNEPYLVWLDYMLNLPKRDLPPVISTSCEISICGHGPLLTTPLASFRRR